MKNRVLTDEGKQLDKALDYLRSYQVRQDAIALGLDRARKFPEAAQEIIQDMLTMTLPQARERVRVREEALSLAIGVLMHGRPSAEANEVLVSRSVVDRIRDLVPDYFEKPASPAKGSN